MATQQVSYTFNEEELNLLVSSSVRQGVLQALQTIQGSHITMSPADGKEWLTRKETARILKCSLPTLKAWSDGGLIKAYKLNTRVRYKASEIDEALRKKTHKH